MANFVWSSASATSKHSVVGTGATADVFGSGAADGMLLEGAGAFAVFVEADSGQTITTSPGLIAYAQDPTSSRWSRAAGWDLPNTDGVTGSRGQYLGGFSVTGPAGRIAYVPDPSNAGAVSSGNLNIRIIATGQRGELL